MNASVAEGWVRETWVRAGVVNEVTRWAVTGADVADNAVLVDAVVAATAAAVDRRSPLWIGVRAMLRWEYWDEALLLLRESSTGRERGQASMTCSA